MTRKEVSHGNQSGSDAVQLVDGRNNPAVRQRRAVRANAGSLPMARTVVHARPIGVDNIRRFSAVTVGYDSVSGVAIKTPVTAGAIFASTKLTLTTWFLAMHLPTQAKNSASALELKRQLGLSWHTAWRVKHKFIAVMAKHESSRQLSGRVEIADTYLGGEQPARRGVTSPISYPLPSPYRRSTT